MTIEYAKVSVVGDRHDNQDRAAIIAGEGAMLMLVFDGMGGHADGAIAAEVGIKFVEETFKAAQLPLFDPQGFLYMTLAKAHDKVVELGIDKPIDFRPRATCAACLVQENGTWWAHIGDSRIYHIRQGEVLIRSRDHSHVELLVQEGAITEEEALDHPMRNFVECCIGGDIAVPEMTLTCKKPLMDGDVLLACSDGFWSGLQNRDLGLLSDCSSGEFAEQLNQLSAKAVSVNAPYSDNTTATALVWRDE